MPKGIQGFQKGNKVQWGDKHWKWKGDKVGYDGIHDWVRLRKGTPRKCEKCGTEKAKIYDWANIDHKYRRVLEDYIRLCKSCHITFDLGKRKTSQNKEVCNNGHKRTKTNTKIRKNGRTLECKDCKRYYVKQNRK